MKIIKLLICLLLLTTLSACNGNSKGPTADTKCVGGEKAPTTGFESTSGSGEEGTAAKIDRALRNCKIITTIVNKVKKEVIGNNGFGDISGSISISSSDSGGSECSSSSFADSSDNSLTPFGAKGIYEAFINSSEFQAAIGAAFTLYIIFYGVALTTGMAKADMGEALVKVLKLSAVSALTLSWGFFYQVVGSFFIEGTDEIIGYFLQNFADFYQTPSGTGASSPIGGSAPSDNIFTNLDNFIARLFSYQTYAFISALFNAGPYAPIYAALLMVSLLWVFQAIVKVVSVYIFSLFAKALLFAVAPIFITFLLFKPTEQLFNAWVKQLVAFSLQPIMIMAFIGLFAQLLQPFFDEFATFKLCWLQLNDAKDKFGWKFVQPNTATITSNDPGVNSSPPVGLQTVLLFAFFAWLFLSSLKMVDGIVQGITQSSATLNEILSLNEITQSKGGFEGLKRTAKTRT